MEYNWHKSIVQCFKKNLKTFFKSDFIKLFLYHASSLILGQKIQITVLREFNPETKKYCILYLSARLKQMAEILVQVIWY